VPVFRIVSFGAAGFSISPPADSQHLAFGSPFDPQAVVRRGLPGEFVEEPWRLIAFLCSGKVIVLIDESISFDAAATLEPL
jgi:hypothetical protein